MPELWAKVGLMTCLYPQELHWQGKRGFQNKRLLIGLLPEYRLTVLGGEPESACDAPFYCPFLSNHGHCLHLRTREMTHVVLSVADALRWVVAS